MRNADRSIALQGGGGEDEDDGEFDGGDASESDSDSDSDAEMIAEEGISVEAVSGAPCAPCVYRVRGCGL